MKRPTTGHRPSTTDHRPPTTDDPGEDAGATVGEPAAEPAVGSDRSVRSERSDQFSLPEGRPPTGSAPAQGSTGTLAPAQASTGTLAPAQGSTGTLASAQASASAPAGALLYRLMGGILLRYLVALKQVTLSRWLGILPESWIQILGEILIVLAFSSWYFRYGARASWRGCLAFGVAFCVFLVPTDFGGRVGLTFADLLSAAIILAVWLQRAGSGPPPGDW